MIGKILYWVNLSLLACAALVVLTYVLRMLSGPTPTPTPSLQGLIVSEADLLKNAFAQPPEAYDHIGPPVLVTSWYTPTLELPDLRTYLNYHGTNDRPDNPASAIRLFFTLRGSDTVASVEPGKPQYLKYDSSKKPGNYIFSPDNQPTHLWFEARKGENKADVTVKMRDEAGRFVTEPASRATLSVTARDFVRSGTAPWEIGKFKVDGTLLARQRARWFGQDQFLNKHGGEEFADVVGRERIEFGEGEERYTIYVKAGDSVVWDGQRWTVVQPGEGSRGLPLMTVQKIEDRLMRLDLWDVGGQGHVLLNLVKSREAWTPKTYERDFKFVSSRTLSQYVFELKNERIVLRPFDWYLLTPEGWKPVVTVDEIDAYVAQKAPGVLFIFNGPVQAEGKNLLRATLFSPARTETFDLEYPLDQTSPILGGQAEQKTPKPPESVEKTPVEEEAPKPPTFEQIPPQDQPQTIEEAEVKARAQEIEQGALESMHPLDTKEREVPEDVPSEEEQEAPITSPVEEVRPPELSEVTQPVEEVPPLELSEAEPVHRYRPVRRRAARVQKESRSIGEMPRPANVKRKPGQLRDDIRYLLQDNSK